LLFSGFLVVGGIRFFNCCGIAQPWKYAHEFFSISTLFKLFFHVQFVLVMREATVAADVSA